jgi:uncharacterized protein
VYSGISVSGVSWLEFDWDDSNVEHIARHNYIPEEVEELFSERHEIRRAANGRYLAYGQTCSGRMTTVVFERKKTSDSSHHGSGHE